MKILVIEDEPEIRKDIVKFFAEENYIVEQAEDYHTAREKIGVYEYDCILLDIGLPGGDGLSLLQELKSENKNGGVIIVSARSSLDDRVTGLNLGADDYLSKPFHMAELHARVKSLIRRKSHHGSSIIDINELRLDTEQRTASVNGTEIQLNRKEFDVLLYLAANKNRLVNKSALAEHVWGDHIDEVNSFDFIYSQIKNLRKKLKDHHTGVEIHAIYGVGYKLTDQ